MRLDGIIVAAAEIRPTAATMGAILRAKVDQSSGFREFQESSAQAGRSGYSVEALAPWPSR